jgi:Kunitz/Bovine pancreatic trypsin inhibitor domain
MSRVLFISLLFINSCCYTSACDTVDNVTASLYREKYCHLPKVLGWCKLRQNRFYYNSTLNECIHFYYEGCAGNRNNFKTIEACECACKMKLVNSMEIPIEDFADGV